MLILFHVLPVRCGNPLILDRVNIPVSEGAAIVGPNGSGKSVVLS